MFCDIVGSTALSDHMDPEEFRELVRAFQQASAVAIQRFGGSIAQYLGDGLLVYFGYPVAHEDDATRAVRSALIILESLVGLNKRLGERVQIRIGIHTGRVVIGEMGALGHHERLALGDTPNIAARVTGCAAPDEVLISAATHRLVEGLFEVQDRGRQMLKGLEAPLALYQVRREGIAQSRFEVAVQAGLTPLVGREKEVALLLELWEKAQRASGQVVLVTGEAGIGKSRLVNELREQVARDGATRIEFRCSPYHQNSVLHPVINYLQRLLQFDREHSPQTKLEKLTQTLATYRFPQSETLALLASLLSLPHPGGHSPVAFSPQRLKRMTQEALVSWVLEEVERAPVCCIWEDLQWADPSSLELLDLYLDQVPTARILLVVSARTETPPRWSPRSFLSHLNLDRLGHAEVREMVLELTGGKPLPDQIIDQVVTKTDGVPLFVEELIRTLLESPFLEAREDGFTMKEPLPPLAIPATLQDSLTARLDQLSTAREVAQIGAALGREFSYELIQAVSPLTETGLQRELARLVGAELIYQTGLPPKARYQFKHALIRDVAYESMLRSKRQSVHGQIAKVLEERFAETVESGPELLAHHYTEAGLTELAIPHWQHAGRRAVERSAGSEAISHLSKALRLLATLPSSPERDDSELALQTTLGPALMAVRGYSAPEVERSYARARELCQNMGDTPALFAVLRGLWGFYVVRADLRTAHQLGEECLALAGRLSEPAYLLWAHYMLGMTLFHLGEFHQSREHLEQGIALYDPEKRRTHRALQDPGVACLCYLAQTLWLLGYPDQAVERSSKALALARSIDHPFSLAYALNLSGVVLQFLGDVDETLRRAEAAIALCKEQDIPYWLSWGTLFRGWAMVQRGSAVEGIEEVRGALSMAGRMGADNARPYWLCLLAESYGKVGQIEEGLMVQKEALSLSEKIKERFYEAELFRVKGELSRLGDARASEIGALEAERCFHRALETARSQGAKSLELRAAISLSRLYRTQGKRNEALRMLEDTYRWFDEGFGTTDLEEAAALIESLRE